MTMPVRHILFADDDVLTQWIMTEVLGRAGFVVTSVCRGTEAIRLMSATSEFDLLLADVDLPTDDNGRALGDHWHATQRRRPLIYTGIRRGYMARQLAQHDYFIEKPLDPGKTLHLIEWALEEASYRPCGSAAIDRVHYVH